MPDRPLYLHEYHPKSELVVESHELLTPKFPAIDVHGHFAALYSDLWLAEMNNPGLIRTVWWICCANAESEES